MHGICIKMSQGLRSLMNVLALYLCSPSYAAIDLFCPSFPYCIQAPLSPLLASPTYLSCLIVLYFFSSFLLFGQVPRLEAIRSHKTNRWPSSRSSRLSSSSMPVPCLTVPSIGLPPHLLSWRVSSSSRLCHSHLCSVIFLFTIHVLCNQPFSN